MIHLLVLLGYKGPLGVLGHVKNEDASLALKQLLRGLQPLFSDNNPKKTISPLQVTISPYMKKTLWVSLCK